MCANVRINIFWFELGLSVPVLSPVGVVADSQMSCKIRLLPGLFEPRSEKTGLRGFRPGPTQIRLYSHRR